MLSIYLRVLHGHCHPSCSAMNKYGRKVLYLYVLWQEEERQTDSSDLATRSILLELSDEGKP